MPASTSPVPAVASQGLDVALIDARPSGAATMVSEPFNSTIAPERAAAARAASSLPPSPIAPNRRANSPSCGVSATGAVRERICANSAAASIGKRRDRVGVEHDGGVARERGKHHRLGALADANAWADQDGILALVSEEAGEVVRIVYGTHHDRRELRGVDRHRVLGRGDGDEPCARAQRAHGAEPCRTGREGGT